MCKHACTHRLFLICLYPEHFQPKLAPLLNTILPWEFEYVEIAMTKAIKHSGNSSVHHRFSRKPSLSLLKSNIAFTWELAASANVPCRGSWRVALTLPSLLSGAGKGYLNGN